MVCADGFYFDTGVCKACQAGAGCSVCDYRKPTECLMCSDGYHQTQPKKACTKSKLVEFYRLAENAEENKKSFERIVKFVGVLMLWILL